MNDVVAPLDDGQTPLNPDEASGLKLHWVRTRGDLDVAEGDNITRSKSWAIARLRRGETVASMGFLEGLHRKMFGEVWSWAGEYRRTERNIGVDPLQIRVQLKQLFDDVAYWDEHDVYEIDERAARLHHALTRIHPFPNGNGRASRFVADYYLQSRRQRPFTWGSRTFADPERRQRYLVAIRQADAHDLMPLLAFVRS